jgi:hypothetical protein
MKLYEIFEETPKAKQVITEAVLSDLPAFEPGISQISNSKSGGWALFLDDGKSFYKFDSDKDATDALKYFTEPEVTPSQFQSKYGKPTANRWSRASIIKTMSEFELAGKKNPAGFVAKALADPKWRGIFRFFSLAGLSAGAVMGSLAAIDEVMNDPSMSREEKERERNILVGVLSTELVLVLMAILRSGSLLRKAMRGLKALVRGIQIGAAATGVGAFPAIVSIILSEAGWIVLGYAMISPSVQRYFAQWIKDTLVGDFFNYVGLAVGTSFSLLDQATDGALGSAQIRRALGFEEGQTSDSADGEIYASSEWAKLVFHDLIFPSGKKVEVPYINPVRREELLFEKLNSMGITVNTNPPAPSPATIPTPDGTNKTIDVTDVDQAGRIRGGI